MEVLIAGIGSEKRKSNSLSYPLFYMSNCRGRRKVRMYTIPTSPNAGGDILAGSPGY
jgi:hypothetical protein